MFGRRKKKGTEKNIPKNPSESPQDLQRQIARLQGELRKTQRSLEKTSSELEGAYSDLETQRRIAQRAQEISGQYKGLIPQINAILDAENGHLALITKNPGSANLLRLLGQKRSAISPEQTHLAQLYKKATEENISLRRAVIGTIASLLSESVKPFRKSPIAIYTSAGDLIFETPRYQKYSDRVEFDPEKAISTLADEIIREGSLTRNYAGIPITYTKFQTPFKTNYVIVSIDSVPLRGKREREREIKLGELERKRATYGREFLGETLESLFSKLAVQPNS